MTIQTITNAQQRDHFMEAASAGTYFVTDGANRAYVAFDSEDGEWYATRPASEEEKVDGEYPAGVTRTIDTLTLPLTIRSTKAHEADHAPDRLAQIIARLDAITDAVWVLADTTDEDSEWFDDCDAPMVVTEDSTPGSYTQIAGDFAQGADDGRADATFVAHAPDDIRWLVSELTRLGAAPSAATTTTEQSARTVAQAVDSHLTRVSTGDLSPLGFVDAVADLVTPLLTPAASNQEG